MGDTTNAADTGDLGEIRPQSLYTREGLCRRAGLTRSSWLAALHKGLRTMKSGKRTFVSGADFIAFVRGEPAAS